MYRMSHPQHGFQMVQTSDRPMFDRAGWSVVVPESVIEKAQEHLDLSTDQVATDQVTTEPKRRGRPRKVATDGDGV